MPLWYTSIIEEHLAVRNKAGIFDVSHMGRVIVDGPDPTKLVELWSPPAPLLRHPESHSTRYFSMPNGGIIDDLIIIKKGEQNYLLVVNAANKAKDISHIKALSAGLDVRIRGRHGLEHNDRRAGT